MTQDDAVAIASAALAMKKAATALLGKTQRLMALLRKHDSAIGGTQVEMIRVTMLSVRAVVTECLDLAGGR